MSLPTSWKRIQDFFNNCPPKKYGNVHFYIMFSNGRMVSKKIKFKDFLGAMWFLYDLEGRITTVTVKTNQGDAIFHIDGKYNELKPEHGSSRLKKWPKLSRKEKNKNIEDLIRKIYQYHADKQ